MTNFYQVEQNINGTLYKAQFNGLSQRYKMRNACKQAIGNAIDVDEEKVVQYLLDNVIIEPHGLTADSFDNSDELDEVISFANDVMRGKFRTKANEKGNKTAGTK